ncbi:MAG: RluA family pseudouridine synthase [Oscillospiraceae bacterium]|nr:RluA family pseudouridine synthase [Oscillospiraceae bacterium]
MSETVPRYVSCTVPAALAGRRVGGLCKTQLRISERVLASVKQRPGGILLNGESVHTDRIVREGDVLAVRVDDWNGENAAAPADVPLQIVYEDEDLAVIEKPAGMAVHGSAAGTGATLANALAFRWGRAQPFHPVHRLDRGTSGLMVVAKSAYAHELLRRELDRGELRREYLALTDGLPEPAAGTVCRPIGREPGHLTHRRVSEDGKRAETVYETVRAARGVALVRLRLLTGRTHQIRVHMASLGCPLLGDALYGGRTDALSHPALHSAFLELCQPITGEKLTFSSEPPEEWQELC